MNLKKSLLSFYLFSASLCLVSAQDAPFTDIEWDYIGNGTTWDDAAAWNVIDRITWKPSTIQTVPDATSRVAVDKDLTVNADRTVSSLMTSYGTPVRTLTIGDANTVTVSALYGNDVFGIRNSSETIAGGLTISGGNLVLTKTEDKTKNMVDGAWDGTWTTVSKAVGTNTIGLNLTENSFKGTAPKTITFDTTANVTSTENIKVIGQANTQSFVVMKGAFTAQYAGVYKSFTAAKSTVNIEKTANVKVGMLSLDNSIMNVDGLLSVTPTGLVKDSSSALIGSGSVLNVNNVLTLVASSNDTANLTISGTLNLNKDGVLHTTGGYGNVNVNAGGVLRLASGVGTFSASSSIRLGGKGTVIFDAPDVWKDVGARSFSLWLSSSSTAEGVGMSYIEVNAHTAFRGLAFGTNSTEKYGAQLTITFGSDPTAILDLEYLTVACDSNQGYLWNKESKLVLINFENGRIRMSKGLREDSGDFYDNLSLITAAGYEDGSFYVEKNADDGFYYLMGVAVPEPATVAAILGALALGFVIYRRRR